MTQPYGDSRPKVFTRPFATQDVAACAQIFAAAWARAFPAHPRVIDEGVFLRETEGEIIVVAEWNGAIAGFAALWPPEAFVHHLYVAPALHNRGIGRALIAALDARAALTAYGARLSLKCQLSNLNARAFYARLGFVEGEAEGDRGMDEIGAWVRLWAD
ncbi:MAG: GNAT family N-acetyltransferase [Hyphomonadaceae bacterium]